MQITEKNKAQQTRRTRKYLTRLNRNFHDLKAEDKESHLQPYTLEAALGSISCVVANHYDDPNGAEIVGAANQTALFIQDLATIPAIRNDVRAGVDQTKRYTSTQLEESIFLTADAAASIIKQMRTKKTQSSLLKEAHENAATGSGYTIHDSVIALYEGKNLSAGEAKALLVMLRQVDVTAIEPETIAKIDYSVRHKLQADIERSRRRYQLLGRLAGSGRDGARPMSFEELVQAEAKKTGIHVDQASRAINHAAAIELIHLYDSSVNT